MIITKRKPDEEILALLDGAKKVAVFGCGECATVCQTGGEDQINEMKAFLNANGIEVLGTIYPQSACNKLLLKQERTARKEVLPDCDAVISMSCGDGTQTAASLLDKPVYPANNTMFLGEVERQGIFTEACRLCSDCILGYTGGICPITKCAKSLVNGPCGGAMDGMCEVNHDNPCAWIEIYKKLKALNQLEKLEKIYEPKGFGNTAYPRTINLREGDKNE
jgi:ferredoxin